MSQNSQDAIDVLSKVIVDTIEKKLNDAKFDKSQTGVVTAVNGNTYTISVFGSQYNITSDQIYTVGQSVVVTALQGDMKRLVCSPDNIGTMKTVDSKVNVVGSQLSTFIDTDFADTIIKYTDVSEFLTLKDQIDGQLSLWFYSGVPSTDTAPTVNWVTNDAKRVHIGDLYYDMKADDAYRWTDTFIWEALSDKNLLKVLRAASLEDDTANGLKRVFFTTPATPYNRGDIWANSSGDNKVLVCQIARATTESFSRTDWAVALKYTDDTKANEALDAAGKIDGDLVSFKTEYNSDLESTKQQIEARVTTEKYNEDMSGLNTRISLTESRISKNENAIILCATKTEAQKYADAAELNANKKLEEHIKTATESIDSKVAKTDYTGKNIATLINQSTNTVKIKATKLNLTGAISVDKNGKVALDSTSVNNSLTQVSGDKITTDTITVDKLKAGQIFQLLWKNNSKDAYSAVGEENKLTFEADGDYKELLKCALLFLIGGALYYCIEILWRGHSHWTMAVVGGICFVVIGGLNNYIPWEMPMWKQGFVGALFVTGMELVVGIPLNLMMGLHIWDYSSLPFNLLGQICLPFTVLWFFLALLCIYVDDWMRYIMFHEDRPHYHWRKVCKPKQ